MCGANFPGPHPRPTRGVEHENIPPRPHGTHARRCTAARAVVGCVDRDRGRPGRHIRRRGRSRPLRRPRGGSTGSDELPRHGRSRRSFRSVTVLQHAQGECLPRGQPGAGRVSDQRRGGLRVDDLGLHLSRLLRDRCLCENRVQRIQPEPAAVQHEHRQHGQGHRHRQLPGGELRLRRSVRLWRPLRLHQGHRGFDVHQPDVLGPVHRGHERRDDPRVPTTSRIRPGPPARPRRRSSSTTAVAGVRTARRSQGRWTSSTAHPPATACRPVR